MDMIMEECLEKSNRNANYSDANSNRSSKNNSSESNNNSNESSSSESDNNGNNNESSSSKSDNNGNSNESRSSESNNNDNSNESNSGKNNNNSSESNNDNNKSNNDSNNNKSNNNSNNNKSSNNSNDIGINCGEFGKCLKKARRDSKTTSDKLGNACGVNPVFIRQIESGTRLPSLPKLVKICDNLQISPAYLLEYELDKKIPQGNWTILVEMQDSLSIDAQHIVKDVLHSMIHNLAEPIRKKNERNVDDTYGMIDKEEFGRRLKKVRQEVKLSSEQLAADCYVNPVFIRQLETGARLPSLSVFVKICNSLLVSPAYLLGNETKIEITGYGWEELVRIQCDMTPKAQQLVEDVLNSLIQNLKKMDKKKR